MSLEQLKGTEITIKKGEGITQAIDRVAKEKNIQITKSELLDLAVQVSKDAQFKGRKITQYSVGGKSYEAVSLVHAGEKFKIEGTAPVIKPTAPVSTASESVSVVAPAAVAPVAKPAASAPAVVTKSVSASASAASVTPALVVAPALAPASAPAPVPAPAFAPAPATQTPAAQPQAPASAPQQKNSSSDNDPSLPWGEIAAGTATAAAIGGLVYGGRRLYKGHKAEKQRVEGVQKELDGIKGLGDNARSDAGKATDARINERAQKTGINPDERGVVSPRDKKDISAD